MKTKKKKIFAHTKKHKELSSSRLSLQECLKKVLQTREKYYQMKTGSVLKNTRKGK